MLLVPQRAEREIIIKHRYERPYGVKLRVLSSHRGVAQGSILGPDGARSLLLEDGKILEIVRYTGQGETRDNAIGDWQVKLYGFATAGEAESAGIKLAMALLWSGISNDNPDYMLSYTTPLPCQVYDRNVGPTLKMYGTGHVVTDRYRAVAEFETAFTALAFDRKLLLAMELYSAAAFARDTRVQFVGLISSLEPLVEQATYLDEAEWGHEVHDVVDAARRALSGSEIPDDIKRSLEGRIRELGRESVRQSFLRLVSQHVTRDEARMMDEAYSLRSKIVHEGESHPDLSRITRTTRSLIRRIFSGYVGLELANNVPLR